MNSCHKIIVIGIAILTFIIGVITGFLLSKSKWVKDKIKIIARKSIVDAIVLFITSVVVVLIFIFKMADVIIKNKALFSTDLINTILEFFVSFVFAYITLKYSTEISFKEKQKESAIRSYRHSINMEDKLEYSIKVTELINMDIDTCNKQNGTSQCQFLHLIKRLKDFLVLARMDASNNKNDWADILSDELNIINEIEQEEQELKQYHEQLQELDPSKDQDAIKKIEQKIEELKKGINEKKKQMNSAVRYALEEKKIFKNQYLEKIEQEIKEKKAGSEQIKLDKQFLEEFKKQLSQNYSKNIATDLLNEIK